MLHVLLCLLLVMLRRLRRHCGVLLLMLSRNLLHHPLQLPALHAHRHDTDTVRNGSQFFHRHASRDGWCCCR